MRSGIILWIVVNLYRPCCYFFFYLNQSVWTSTLSTESKSVVGDNMCWFLNRLDDPLGHSKQVLHPSSLYLATEKWYTYKTSHKKTSQDKMSQGTKRPKGQNVQREKKTSQGTKRPKGQNVLNDKTSQGDKWGPLSNMYGQLPYLIWPGLRNDLA